MTADLQIKFLADCPEHIPELAELWLNEIGKQWIPNASYEEAVKKYLTHLNKRDLPLTIVMLDGDQPIGMASLRENDGIREDLTPWLGALIVHPEYRKRGLGEMLINVVMQRTKAFGYKKLFLLTFDAKLPDWYANLGWKKIGMDKLCEHPVTVMEILV